MVKSPLLIFMFFFLSFSIYSQSYEIVKPTILRDFYSDYGGKKVQLNSVYISTYLNKEKINSLDSYLVAIETKDKKAITYPTFGDLLSGCLTAGLTRKYSSFMAENENDGAGGYLANIKAEILEMKLDKSDRFPYMDVTLFLIDEIDIISASGKVLKTIK